MKGNYQVCVADKELKLSCYNKEALLFTIHPEYGSLKLSSLTATKVEAMCLQLRRREQYLDIIVNNACQTIRRPAAYYAHLLHEEAQPYPSLTRGPLLQLESSLAESLTDEALSLPPSGMGSSAALSQLLVLEEDRLKEEAVALPAGARDVNGQQLDLRSTNSWLLKLGEVETPEAVEVFCINAMAPFILNSRLRPLLESSPHPDRYVVNVSAMEGKFYRYKQPTHPHTNMAKAALNMTLGEYCWISVNLNKTKHGTKTSIALLSPFPALSSLLSS